MPTDKPAIRIRKAEAGDVQGILECLQDAFDAYREVYTSGAFQDTVPTRGDLEDRLAAMCVLVAIVSSDEIVGTVACSLVDSEEGHVRGMAVRRAWHGAGVASRLLRSIEGELRDRGCSRISLDTTLPLERAIQFYEKHGFRRSGRITDFFGMQLIEYVKVVGLGNKVES